MKTVLFFTCVTATFFCWVFWMMAVFSTPPPDGTYLVSFVHGNPGASFYTTSCRTVTVSYPMDEEGIDLLMKDLKSKMGTTNLALVNIVKLPIK